MWGEEEELGEQVDRSVKECLGIDEKKEEEKEEGSGRK